MSSFIARTALVAASALISTGAAHAQAVQSEAAVVRSASFEQFIGRVGGAKVETPAPVARIVPASFSPVVVAQPALVAAPARPAPSVRTPEAKPAAARIVQRRDDVERGCLAEAIMHEAGGEPEAGRIAVAEVIMNRAKSGIFPASICGVVNQKGQFTYPHGRPVKAAQQSRWQDAVSLASRMMAGVVQPVLQGAMYFHSVRVRPDWSTTARRITKIGAHVFYARR